jgi:hypothetical protein
VFFNDALVLNRHFPTGELDHLRAGLPMSFV